MAKKINKTNFELALKNAKNNFGNSSKFEIKTRESLYAFIANCHIINAENSTTFLEKEFEKIQKKYVHNKKAKMILQLATGYYEIKKDVDKKRINKTIAGYVRMLTSFKSKGFNFTQVTENLNKYGVDYFVNKRSENVLDTKEREKTKDTEITYSDRVKTFIKGTKYEGKRNILIFKMNEKIRVRSNKFLIQEIEKLIKKYDEEKNNS